MGSRQTSLIGRDVGWRIGSAAGGLKDALVWDLDEMAGRCYVEMVEHFEDCSTCETAGAELARETSKLCPSGRRRRAAWEAAETRSAGARGGLRV